MRTLRRIIDRVPTWAIAVLFVVSMLILVLLTGEVPEVVV